MNYALIIMNYALSIMNYALSIMNYALSIMTDYEDNDFVRGAWHKAETLD